MNYLLILMVVMGLLIFQGRYEYDPNIIKSIKDDVGKIIGSFSLRDL